MQRLGQGEEAGRPRASSPPAAPNSGGCKLINSNTTRSGARVLTILQMEAMFLTVI